MKFKKIFILRTIFVITAFLIDLFLFPQTVLADACDQFWRSCAECMTAGQSSNCIWVQPGVMRDGSCMNKDKLYGYPTGNYYLTCASNAASQPTPTPVPQQAPAINCPSITSCTECLSHQDCGWCYDGCVTWVGSSSICQMHSVPSASQCPENQAAPTTIPTVKVLPISTPTPTLTLASKKADGQSCQVNYDCKSGNCTNYVCCIKGKVCCSQSNFCPTDQYCSTSRDRFYCLPKWDNGISCTANDQCKSKNCGKGICCGGQPCCKVDSDCGKDEYCETKDTLYYCRIKWNIGEYCEKASACRSDYCDTYTQKCAEYPKKITPSPKKAVCGDNSCDDWLGENCCNCPKDCATIPDFCCAQKSKFAKSKDWQNKVFNLYDAPGGAIPSGRLVVPEKIDEKTYFSSYQPKICQDGKIIEGECFKSDQCAEGICVEGKCTTASSDEPQEVKDEKIAQEIYNNQTNYLKEDVWVNVYDVIKGNIISSTRVEGNLEINLEVQGATAGKTSEVKVGNSLRSWLKIVNNTNYSIAVVAGIVYPGQLANSFKLKETEYDLSCSRNDGKNPLVSFIGSTNAARLGGQYFILPSDHRLIIHSDVTPQQEGYLDVQGLVYYSKEKMYANSSLVQAKIAPVNFENIFQKAEVSESVLVTKKDCYWFYCL